MKKDNNRYLPLCWKFFVKKRKNFVGEKEKIKRIYGRRKVYGKERKICKRERENEYDVRRND